MKNFAPVFNQYLKYVPRSVFNKCVDKFKGDYRVRTFKCWSQFGVMLYAQITAKISLRDIVTGFSHKQNYFYHLGFKEVKRSTLADANQKRDWQIYEKLFNQVLWSCGDVSPRHKFRFKNKLESLDSTTIDLCLDVFSWADFRQTKGGIKIHTKIDHGGHLPNFINITNAKTADINGASNIKQEPGSILVVDKGYVKYKWLYQIDQQSAFWVTRIKKNMKYTPVEKPEHKLPEISTQAREKGGDQRSNHSTDKSTSFS